MVAVNAKNLISVSELFRTVPENRPRNAAIINNLNEQAGERQLISVLFLYLGTAARKSLTDIYPLMVLATVSLQELKENCEQALENNEIEH